MRLGKVGVAGALVCALAGCLAAQQAPASASVDIRSSFYRGRPVTYHVIDGLAIYEGDIILGTAEVLEAARVESPKTGRREAIGVPTESDRWPDGVVFYVIDAGLPNQNRVNSAIAHWEANTPITFRVRSGESAYVRFVRDFSGVCSSNVGRTGGVQQIRLDDACSTANTIHEIGHTVGLWHEQSRADRDRFVAVMYQNIDKRYADNYDQELLDGDDIGSYDFASIMHYSPYSFTRNGLPAMETIPPGIPLRSAQVLSFGDIDGVWRMYNQPPTRTTIATNPAGLRVLVDGMEYTSSASFDWGAGETHTVSVVSPQESGFTRYAFGRWSDDGSQTHTITASPDVTVFTANFVQQYRVMAAVGAGGGGSVSLSPASTDGYYANRSEVELQALPNAGFNFLEWSGTQTGSANPKKIIVTGTNSVTGFFTQSTLTTITSDPPGLQVFVDGVPRTTPQSFAWNAGTSHSLEAATQTSDLVRYVLKTAPPSTVTATSSPAVHTVEFIKQHMLSTSVATGGGNLAVSPAPTQGYINDGTTVEFTASPVPGWHLDYWIGDLGGYQLTETLVAHDQMLVTARFTPNQGTPTIAVWNAASSSAGEVAPGEIVVIGGNGLFPQGTVFAQLDGSGRFPTELAGVRVTFGGVAAPLIAIQAGVCTAIVPYSLTAGWSTLQVEFQGRRTTLNVLVAGSAPGIFALDSSGRGRGAILNEDSVTVNSPAQPSARGSVIVIYATGAGQTDPPGQDGRIVPASGGLASYPKPLLPVSVRIGGAPAEILYAGAAPDLVSGALQVNARVPVNIDVGDHVPVILTVGDRTSLPAITVAVR